jgi:hypothetical protein
MPLTLYFGRGSKRSGKLYQTEYPEAPEWVGFPGAKGYSIWYSFPGHFEDTGKDPIFKMTTPNRPKKGLFIWNIWQRTVLPCYHFILADIPKDLGNCVNLNILWLQSKLVSLEPKAVQFGTVSQVLSKTQEKIQFS